MTIEEINIENSKLSSKITKAAIVRECLLKDCNDDCSEDIINAHSLQRLGSLTRLEASVNGNMCLYTLTEKQINPKSKLLELKPIGKKVASTFFGFCGKHDLKIFQPIEQKPDLLDIESDEHCFLLSFKAFAISYHRKKEDLKLLSTKDENLRTDIRKYYNTERIEEQLKGVKLAMNDMEPTKTKLVKALYSKDYSCLDYFALELHYTAPIGMCMVTSPPYLFDGTPINLSDDPNIYSDIFTSVIPLKSKTLVVLAVLKDDSNGSMYLNELENMSDYALQKALTWHVLTNSENCFFSPIWYNSLTPRQKHSFVYMSDYNGSVTTPFLRYDPRKFTWNLFDPRIGI